MPKKGGKRRKTRTHVAEVKDDDKNPKSFVFKKGKVPFPVQCLTQDVRRVMQPYTADKLKEKKSNSVKDFVQVAAPMGVTHFLFFSTTEKSVNMKIARIPRGPTLSFKVEGYTLMRHIHTLQKRPVDTSLAFRTSPLVVLNNFTGDEDHVKLMNVTFQNMFPAIDVQTIVLAECRRVVLFHYDKETKLVEFRQFVIRANPIGLTKSVKNIVRSRIPNLSKVDDISDYVFGNGNVGIDGASDSEVDDEDSHVVLPDDFRGKGNKKSEQSAIRLSEIGPRLTLQLAKVERDLCEGDVLYHAFVSKTPEEAANLKMKREQSLALKKRRREQQGQNVEKKTKLKEEKKAAKLARKEGIKNNSGEDSGDDSEVDETTADKIEVVDSDSDAEYYRKEVGEEPDEDLFRKDKRQKTENKSKVVIQKGGAAIGRRNIPQGKKKKNSKDNEEDHKKKYFSKVDKKSVGWKGKDRSSKGGRR